MNTRTHKTGTRISLALLLSLAAVACATPAHAMGWGFSVGLGLPVPAVCAPAPVVVVNPPVVETRQWVPAHYELRTETVLVAPARVVRQWVVPAYQLRYDLYGQPYRAAVRGGYVTEVPVPARYETRSVRVLVPGYYVS